MEWRQMWENYKQIKSIPPNPRNQCRSTNNTFFFFVNSHDMSQYADSNVRHVMSSTKLMQSQQTPLQFPFPASRLV